jgi:hypothetical protein
MTGSILGTLAFALILGVGVRWLQAMQRVAVPADMRLYLLAMPSAPASASSP